MRVMEPSARFWQRIVEIVGSDDPTDVAYMLGVSYATATRYKTGAVGTSGPNAATLEAMAKSLSARRGVDYTIGQIWGSDPLPPDSTSAVTEGTVATGRAFLQRARTNLQQEPEAHGKSRKGR